MSNSFALNIIKMWSLIFWSSKYELWCSDSVYVSGSVQERCDSIANALIHPWILWELLMALWLHQMETFSHYWPFVRGIHRSPMNSPYKGQWCRALMFSLIWAWTNCSVNNRDAGDLRRHHTHYDVTVMNWILNKMAAILQMSFWDAKKPAFLFP